MCSLQHTHQMARAAAARLLPALLIAPACTAQMDWLHVRPVDLDAAPNATRRFVIADDTGREVTLRGVCLEQEERSFPPYQRPIDPALYANGSCPVNLAGYQEPPVCEVAAGRGKYAADVSYGSQNDLAQVRQPGRRRDAGHCRDAGAVRRVRVRPRARRTRALTPPPPSPSRPRRSGTWA